MKKTSLIIAMLFLFINTFAQEKSSSPYEWNWTKDGIWTGTALAGAVGGLYLIGEKKDLTEAAFAAEIANQDNIWFVDKWAVGNNNEDASKLSDIPFGISFATPFLLLLDDETNEHSAQVGGLYLESLATTAALFTLTAGIVNKSRPYVYDETGETPLNRRLGSNGQRSFYSGHVAATATASFFAVKVYSDFNPDAKNMGLLWTGAAILPAAVGYLRIEAGQHFLSDVLIGYGMGAAVGYFVPELHKIKNDTGLSFTPAGGRSLTGDLYNGMAVKFEF